MTKSILFVLGLLMACMLVVVMGLVAPLNTDTVMAETLPLEEVVLESGDSVPPGVQYVRQYTTRPGWKSYQEQLWYCSWEGSSTPVPSKCWWGKGD